jgi:hypothetical protein
MTEPLFSYRQRVASAGYQWAEYELANGGSETVLSYAGLDEANPLREPKFRTYEPLRDEPALFMNLADLSPEPEAILAFANRYGPLDLSFLKLYANPRSKRKPELRICREPLETWLTAIRWLQYFVRLWQTVRAGDRPALARFIAIEGAAAIFHDGDVPPDPLQEEQSIPPGVLLLRAVQDMGFAKDDLIGAAILFVQMRLNNALRGHVSPAVVWDKERMRPAMSSEVRSLWGAILVQFAQAIAENRDYQHCAACGRWMELAPGVSRSDRLTCSDACRQKLHRMRHHQALELHAAGKKPATIARETGSDVETVRRWIAKSKEEK